VTIVSPLGAMPHPPGPNARFNILRYFISGKYTTPSDFISTSSRFTGAMRISADSLLKGVEERPWKERDQSTGPPLESRGMASGVGLDGKGAMGSTAGGSSSRPFFNERMLDCDVISFRGAGFVGVEVTLTVTPFLDGAAFAVDEDEVGGEEAVDCVDAVDDAGAVVVRVEEVDEVDVRVVGRARLTPTARAVDVFEKLRRPL
jgi:hypothetical protein